MQNPRDPGAGIAGASRVSLGGRDTSARSDPALANQAVQPACGDNRLVDADDALDALEAFNRKHSVNVKLWQEEGSDVLFLGLQNGEKRLIDPADPACILDNLRRLDDQLSGRQRINGASPANSRGRRGRRPDPNVAARPFDMSCPNWREIDPADAAAYRARGMLPIMDGATGRWYVFEGDPSTSATPGEATTGSPRRSPTGRPVKATWRT
jgi:hypothetical protein